MLSFGLTKMLVTELLPYSTDLLNNGVLVDTKLCDDDDALCDDADDNEDDTEHTSPY